MRFKIDSEKNLTTKLYHSVIQQFVIQEFVIQEFVIQYFVIQKFVIHQFVSVCHSEVCHSGVCHSGVCRSGVNYNTLHSCILYFIYINIPYWFPIIKKICSLIIFIFHFCRAKSFSFCRANSFSLSKNIFFSLFLKYFDVKHGCITEIYFK